MAGQFVLIETDVIGVAIQAKPRRGSYIVSISEADQEGEGGSAPSEQKAS